MNKEIVILALLLSSCQASTGLPQAQPSATLPTEALTPGSKGENLTPGSKGESLTPTSKGEHKLSEIRGEVALPLNVPDFRSEPLRFLLDGQELKPEQWQIQILSEQRFSYVIQELEVGSNLVLDVESGAIQLSRMIPELSETVLEAQTLDLSSTAVVAIARLAEEKGIRSLKSWKQDELAQLMGLPELTQLSQAYAEVYSESIDTAEQAQLDEITERLLQIFLARLESLDG